MSPRVDLIQLRNGTAGAWASANPVLAAGETGAEKDTGRVKVGDGVKNWNTLSYADDATRALALPLIQKGAASGVATLGADGKVTPTQLLLGAPSGIATLGSNGKIPATQIPGTVNGKMPYRALRLPTTYQMPSFGGYVNTWAPGPYGDQGDGCGIVLDQNGEVTFTTAGMYQINLDMAWRSEALIGKFKVEVLGEDIVTGISNRWYAEKKVQASLTGWADPGNGCYWTYMSLSKVVYPPLDSRMSIHVSNYTFSGEADATPNLPIELIATANTWDIAYIGP